MKQNDLSAQMLIAEFEMLSNAFLQKSQQDHEKLNLYIALISAGLGALLLLGQGKILSQREPLVIALPLLFLLLMVGWSTLQALATSRVIADEYLRGMNRVRIYFAERDKTLAKYFVFPLDDLPTAVISFPTETRTAPASHYMMQTVIVLNSALCSLIGIDLLLIVCSRPVYLSPYLVPLSACMGIVFFGASIWFQITFYRHKLSKARQRAVETTSFVSNETGSIEQPGQVIAR